MPISFPRNMDDIELANVIKDGAISVSQKRISYSLFQDGMRELAKIYGKERIYRIKESLIKDFNVPSVNVYAIDELKDEIKPIKSNELYMQQMEAVRELSKHLDKEVYRQMFQYFNVDRIKYIDEPPKINYKNPRDDVRENEANEGQAMQGIEYINNMRGEKAYKHMRAMLQCVWNIQCKHPQDRFDIDIKFGYDSKNIASYIKANASLNEINAAHIGARAQYGGRGRPKGARNKDKVVGKDFSELDNLIEDLQGDNDVKENNIPQEPVKLADGQNIDLSKFVTHPQLDRKAAELRSDMNNISKAITDALLESFETLETKVNGIKLQTPTVVELKQEAGPNIQLGVQHRYFPDLLTMCHARLSADNDGRCNVWLFGPAGMGKTTAAKMVAKALNLDFYMQSALETGFQILGYVDAHGKYVTTLFRQCWEHGGVIILDEIDSYLPSAAMALNGALANGACPFADKVVPRHKDCIIIAGANTTGLGGTIEYTGRNKMDAATLDRFVMLDWPIDEALEAHLCPNTAWLAIVRHCREQVQAKQIKGIMVTPRASIYGSALLRAGLSIDRVMASTIKKGMTDAQWQQIKPSQSLIDNVM